MSYNPNIHHRRSIRLKGYDYTQIGAYFITICTYQRNCLFGEIANREMQLNTNGEIAKRSWLSIPRHFLNVKLDEFVIMPNHLHGIIIINEDLQNKDVVHSNCEINSENRQGEALANLHSQHQQTFSSQCFAPTEKKMNDNGTKPQSLGAIVQNYKSVCTRKINQINKTKGNAVWQRNYYEHIIRNEEELNHVRQYIIDNPVNWLKDTENPLLTSQHL